MKYKVIITPNAEDNLDDIKDYILYTLRSPENAASVMSRLKNAIMSLDENPERFQRFDRPTRNGNSLRRFPVDNYLVFYYVDNENNKVYITNVINGRRNLDYLFN